MEQVKDSREAIKEIWGKYKKTGQDKWRNKLMEHYLPVVRMIATRLKTQLPQSVDTDDLISAGTIGLKTAIELYDLNRGVKFETYCFNRIRGAMLDELRSLDWVPRQVRIKEHLWMRAYNKLEGGLGRTPTPYEIADELKISPEDYTELKQQTSVPNMLLITCKRDISSENDKDVKLLDILKDNNADDSFRQMVLQDLIEYIKGNLSERKRLVLMLYFYDNLTMKEIAEVLEVSESRVSQIYNSVITQLRRMFQRRKMEWLV